MKKFDHFKSNLNVLALADQEDLTNEFIIGGIIDKFFIQFELGWKVLKELLSYEGQSISASGSPKMILKTAATRLRPVRRKSRNTEMNSRIHMKRQREVTLTM